MVKATKLGRELVYNKVKPGLYTYTSVYTLVKLIEGLVYRPSSPSTQPPQVRAGKNARGARYGAVRGEAVPLDA